MRSPRKIKSQKKLASFIVMSAIGLLVSMFAISPALSQDMFQEGEPGAVELDEAHFPIMFHDDFDDLTIDPDAWAYHVLRAGVGIDNQASSIPVLQIGHGNEWAGVVLMEGNDWRNYIVEMDVKLLALVDDADAFFLGVRYDRNKGEYALSLDMAGQMAVLSSTIDGRWQGISHQTPLALDIDVWYRLKVRVEYDVIDFFVDDVYIGRINDDTLATGSLRMLTPPRSFVHVDNVIVREIPSAPEPGDVLITEFMFRDRGLQWFEIVNDSNKYVKLDGIQITNGSEVHEIGRGSLVIGPRRYKVFAAQDTTPFFALDSQPYIYGDVLRFPIDNGYLGLSIDGRTITEIEYSEDTGWPLQDNVSVALHPDYHTRRRQNNGFHWCLSVKRVADSSLMRATPGQPNHGCVRELPFNDYGHRQTGGLVITEIMIDLPGPDQGREWFEIYNTTDSVLSLKGLTIATDSPTEKYVISEEFNISPHSYGVLAQAGLLTNELPDNLPIYYYSGQLNLRNSNGELTIRDGKRVVDSVTWRDNVRWPVRAGMSMSLHPEAISAYSNDDTLNWCLAWTPVVGSLTLLGTPGKPNDPCPMWEINSPLQGVAGAYEEATGTISNPKAKRHLLRRLVVREIFTP